MASSFTIVPLLFLVFTTFYYNGEARSFVVGGSSHGWKVPSPKDAFDHWAEKSRFKVGDVLVFNYEARSDSVLQVTKENYESCNVEKPMKEYKGGSNNVTLDVSGPHYFISGAQGNCSKGEKLVVVVQSQDHSKPEPVAAPPTPPSKPPTNTASPAAPGPAPAGNVAVGLVAGSGFFWAFVAVVGLALA